MSTSLSVREVRAKMLHDELRARPELVERATDIDQLPRFAGWRRDIRCAAIDDCVARGAIAEAADGRLVVKPWTVSA